MRRLELPKLMHINPCDPRRCGVGARELMAAHWYKAFGAMKRRRLTFPKKNKP